MLSTKSILFLYFEQLTDPIVLFAIGPDSMVAEVCFSFSSSDCCHIAESIVRISRSINASQINIAEQSRAERREGEAGGQDSRLDNWPPLGAGIS